MENPKESSNIEKLVVFLNTSNEVKESKYYNKLLVQLSWKSIKNGSQT